MPLPVRTWRLTPMQVFASPSGTVTSRLVQLDDFITNHMTHWETSVLDGSGTKEYMEIKPVAGAPASIQNYRMMVAGTAPSEAVPSAGLVSPLTTASSAEQLFVSYAPDVGGTYPGAGAAADWKSGNPWANAVPVVGNRYSGWHRWANANGDWVAMFAIECEDMFCIVPVHSSLVTAGTQYQYPMIAGAIWETPSVALGDSVRGDEAMYGLGIAGNQYVGVSPLGRIWANINWGSSDVLFLQGINSNQPTLQGMVTALDPSSAVSGSLRLMRLLTSQYHEPSFGDYNKQLDIAPFRFQDGREVADPIPYRWVQTLEKKRAANLRQMYPGAKRLSGVEIFDSAGVSQGASISRYLTQEGGDALLFLNQSYARS